MAKSNISDYFQAIYDDDLGCLKNLENDPIATKIINDDIRKIYKEIFDWDLSIAKYPNFKDYCCMAAARHGKLKILKYLHKIGANIRIEDDWCFRWAAWAGHESTIKYLFQNGANIYASDRMAFKEAEKNKKLNITELLQEFAKTTSPYDLDLYIINAFINNSTHVSFQKYLQTLHENGILFSYQNYYTEIFKLNPGDWEFIIQKLYQNIPDHVLMGINEKYSEIPNCKWLNTVIAEDKTIEDRYPKIVIAFLRNKIKELNI